MLIYYSYKYCLYFLSDLDECKSSDLNDCEQQDYCHNYKGGYRCGCGTLYTLSQNGLTCDNSNFLAFVGGTVGVMILILFAAVIGLCVCKVAKKSRSVEEVGQQNPL